MSNHSNRASVKTKTQYIEIKEDISGQRIDNFLLTYLKDMPKSRIYRLLRKGEIRVNKKRIKPFYRILEGDIIKLPPLFLAEKAKEAPPSETTASLLLKRIIFEDENFLIINKPSGISVHAGNTVRMGVVEILRHLHPKLPHLELAHRLDAETSGCLILAKKKRILREVHQLLREGKMAKIYWAFTQGQWKSSEYKVDLPLHKDYRDGGKHVVEVNRAEGKTAMSEFHPLKQFNEASLVEVKLLTGRTHQIRVHAAHFHHPIAGDDRYGNTVFNQKMREYGLKRMFLHARSIDFTLPSNNQRIKVEAPLDTDLNQFLKKYEHDN